MSNRSSVLAAHVVRVEQLSRLMRRITVGGPDLARFTTAGRDQVVRMFLPLAGQELVLPEGPDWWGGYHAIPQVHRPALRNYTVRRFDPATGELDVDFVLHGDEGPASAWAGRAAPGDPLGVYPDAATAEVPDGTDWQLLVADETGLPAVGAILEGLAPGTRAVAFVEIADPDEEQDLRSGADVDLVWLHRDGVPAGRSDVVVTALAAAQLPPGPVFAWVAGESGMVKAVRRHLVSERGVPRKRVEFSGYWLHREHDTPAFTAELEALYAEQ
ncbi:hypothetical protein BJF78_29550 [Pseudonocardia sp. CNS-139]|nr:hypothetical protein BJF78_29550 [Pseudonocardia sp. CNS-139]